MIKGISINVASSSQYPNGRGAIDPANNSFEYLPIPETKDCTGNIPTYSDLKWIEPQKLKKPGLKVHLDPEFETYTYGHVKRGFGDVNSLLSLEKGEYLFFHSTLSHIKDPSKWVTAIIGYFEVDDVIDCRKVSNDEIKENYRERFGNNAHLKREQPNVDFLVKGSEDSKLLKKAILLSDFDSPRKLKDYFKDTITTTGGKKIKDDHPWYRWTLKVTEPEEILKE